MQSNLESRVARLEQMDGTSSNVVVVFDDAPAPTDESVSFVRVRFVAALLQENDHES